MDFASSEHHELLRKSVRDFARAEVLPHARHWDEAEQLPKEILPKLASLGLLGICVPEEHGGSGMDWASYAICVEELARVDGSVALVVASHNAVVSALVATNDDALVARAVSGEALVSSVTGEAATATRESDAWKLHGTKRAYGYGEGACLVVAGENAFVVETAKLTASPVPTLGCRASGAVEIVLDGVVVPESQRVARGELRDRSRLGLAAMALGLGYGALDMGVTYAKERKQFGRPIGDFQALQWFIADGKTELDAAQLLVYRAAWLADAGRPFAREASMAKLFASEAATRACHHALQIHGGYGYTRELAVERHLRDAKHCEIGEGTSDAQRAFLASELLTAS